MWGMNHHHRSSAPADPKSHTTRPIVTGASVLGVKYNGGVMLAADTLLSYGSMAKTMNASRLMEIDQTLIGASGEYSDFQAIQEMLEAKSLQMQSGLLQEREGDEPPMTARSMWNYLRVVMYHRRNKMNPLWNSVVVAGKDGATGEFFLGNVDRLGTTVEDNIMATGFGAYMGVPLLREKWRPDMDEGEARALLEDCMKVLYYRDCRAASRIQLAKVSADGVLISEPYELETSWAGSTDYIPLNTPLALP
ncbi:Proteasome subunit beta type-4 (Fragment) [Seminavis robusta]|uniref:Proteasome subunit beta n=1 Tax=Seminavis robusta TaxID=568900 RepID=A0A9N8D988_9STRA